MTQEITAAEYVAMQQKQPTRKYKNEPTIVDGIRFDSKAEARRWGELKLLEEAGEITGLARQVRMKLEVNGVKIGEYRPDFTYVDLRSGTTVVEDTKSEPTKTPTYRLKKKLVKALYGIEIVEIT